MKKNPPERFIGIDISKKSLDIADSLTQQTWQSSNDESGIKNLVEQLIPLNPVLIVLEATGGLEIHLASALVEAHLPVAVVNPRHARELC